MAILPEKIKLLLIVFYHSFFLKLSLSEDDSQKEN